MSNNWFQYLKSAYFVKLPPDKLSPGHKYGRFRDNVKYVLPSVFANWKMGVIGISLLVLKSFLTYPGPMITRYLIDNVLTKKNFSLLLPVLTLLAMIWVFSSLIGQFQSFFNTRFSQEVTLDLQQKVISRVLSFPKSFFDHMHKGYLMSRITSDIGGVNWFISGTVVQIFLQIFKLVGGIGFLFYLEWRIALPVVLSLPAPFLVTIFFMRRSYIMGHINGERMARYSAFFQELIGSIPLIKTFSTEKRTEEKLIGEIRQNYKFSNMQNIVNSLNGNIMQLMPTLARFFVLAFGSYWVISGHWSIGSLLAFQMYLAFVYSPVSYLSSTITQFQQTRVSMERVAAIFDKLPEDNFDTGIEVERLNGRIEFKNVDFSYDPKEPVLRNISFLTNPGEHWAIIGLSGIGKTTLVSLIMRLYNPGNGEILFDNTPASKYNVRALRRRIGYVAQKTELLSGTIIDNIKYGNEDASYEEVVRAAVIADIHEFINTHPPKYDTYLEEGGANLSEGQKQRLSIARALVKNPDIIIFDEPTASLDNHTEETIYNALPNVVRNRTVFTIAHRLNTVRCADKIIYLRKNLPPLIGTHTELNEHKDYREFFND